MANTVRIKRRSSGSPGAPASLENAELAFNEVDETLYIGKGTGGTGGSATSILAIGGSAKADAHNAVFTGTPTAPTPTGGSAGTQIATKDYVLQSIGSAAVSDGDKGDIIVSSSGTAWSIDNGVISNAKLADVPTGTFKGRIAAGSGAPTDLTVVDMRNVLSISNVDNTSDADKPISTAVQAALDSKIDNSTKGAANGVAPLGADAKIAATYLPSYVDDVLEFSNEAAFPPTGATGVIYTALDTNKIYRWGGTVYVEISPSPGSTDAVAEGATNLYFTEARARAAVIAATIVDNDTTHSPSNEAVFEALAGKQPLNAILTSLAAGTALPIENGGTGATTVGEARTNLGLGTMATQNANAVAITGGTIDNIVLDGGTF